MELAATVTFHVKNKIREVQSQNVIAKLEGIDPALKNEYVIYSAHWDHLGRDTALKGDQIFNGAIDNASGVAMLLEIAKAYASLRVPPKRSILFLSVTAEEQGLLGAKHYAAHPLYPLAQTIANINMDGINPHGITRDIVQIGIGHSTIDEEAHAVAAMQGRVISPDPESEKGYFFRSDHFEFAKKGVPAFYTDTGTDYVGKDPEFATRKREEYRQKDYHKPSDEVKPDWDLSGAVQDGQFLFLLGDRLAESPNRPEWKPGSEFSRGR